MCLAKATLAYGLTVRSSSLVFASDAWTRLKHSFRFFQLVFLRRRSGGLVSTTRGGGGPVTKVPNEVWEEIRYWLVQEEVKQSEENLLDPLFCEDPRCLARPPPNVRTHWSLLERFESCNDCVDALCDWLRDNIMEWEEDRIEEITHLVETFGLSLPSHSPALVDENEADSMTSALAFVTAPSGFQKNRYKKTVVQACSGVGMADDGFTIVDVSLDNLPPDIDLRFKRLIQLFNLVVVDSAADELSPRASGTVDRPPGRRLRSPPSGVADRVTEEIRPRWKLFVGCIFYE
ncbi:hypothetical protein JCM5350_002768 [Sporobolomyces pararoseus]